MPSTRDIRLILRAELDKALSDWEKANRKLDDTSQKAKKVDSDFKGAITAVKAFVAALAVKEITEGVVQLGKMGAELINVERAFRKLEGSTQLLNDLQEATKGGVADIELMRTAITGIDLGATNEQIKTFAEFARFEGVRKGVDTLQVFNNIIGGVLRGSTELLDNFGITLAQLNRELETLAQERLGVAASKLSQLERRELQVEAATRIMNRRLRESGDIAITDAERIANAAVAWENLSRQLGKVFSPLVAGLAERLANALGSIASSDLFKILTLEGLDRLVVQNRAAMNRALEEARKIEGELQRGLQVIHGGTEREQVLPISSTARRRLEERRKVLLAEAAAFENALNIQLNEQRRREATRERRATLARLGRNERTDLVDEFNKALFDSSEEEYQKLMERWERQAMQLMPEEAVDILERIGDEIKRNTELAFVFADVIATPFHTFISGMLDATTTGSQVWRAFLQDLESQLRNFIAGQVVATFLQLIANAIGVRVPGVGSAGFGSLVVGPSALAGVAGAQAPRLPGPGPSQLGGSVTNNRSSSNIVNNNFNGAVLDGQKLLRYVESARLRDIERFGSGLNREAF